MFRFWRTMRSLELTEADLLPISLLDRSANSVTATLDHLRGDEVAQERSIGEMTERLRQTRVAIAAFESAGAIIDDGKDIAVAPPTKIGRLVPRAVPAVPQAIHTDIRA